MAAHRPWTLDARSIAVGRIALGLACIAATLDRIRNLDAFFTDAGVLPGALSLRLLNYPTAFKLYFLSGSHAYAAVLLGLHLVLAIMLTVGSWPRAAAVGCFFLTLGERERAVLTLDGCDDLMLAYLIWAAFLPTGARASWDSLRGKPPTVAPTEVTSIATLGLLLQVSVVYFTTAVFKNGAGWRLNGSAVYYALSISHFALPPAYWLRTHRALCQVLTFGTLAWELGGPFLLWIPRTGTLLRLFTVLGFIGMHIGFSTFLNLGFFSATAISAWLMLLPGAVWDRLGWPSAPAWLRNAARRLPRAGSTAPSPVEPSRVGRIAGAIAVVLLAIGNAHALGLPIPRPLDATLQTFAFDQYWQMFSPSPPSTHGWEVFPAKTASGTEVDLLTQAPATWERPELGWGFGADRRWGNYLRAMQDPGLKPFYRPFFRYLCHRWNDARPAAEQVTRVQAVFMHVETTPTESDPPPVREVLAEGSCAESST